MSADQNANNYRGATVTLVGYAATDPRFPAYDKEGKRGIKEVPIAHTEGYKKDGQFVETGTTWYQVTGRADDLDGLGIGKGDLLRIDDAKQEVREYKNRDGEDKLGITLSFGQITVLESKNSSEDVTPF